MTLSTEEAVADSSLVKGRVRGGAQNWKKKFFAFLDELEYSRRVWNFV